MQREFIERGKKLAETRQNLEILTLEVEKLSKAGTAEKIDQNFKKYELSILKTVTRMIEKQ